MSSPSINSAPRWDHRALRFAIGFPVVLSAAFVIATSSLSSRLPSPVAIMWDGAGARAFVPFGTYMLVAVGTILLVGVALLLQTVSLARPVVMRRILMALGIAADLFLVTVFAAGLVGQLNVADARNSHVDTMVLLLGSGAAVTLALVMGMLYKPDEKWSPADDRALERELLLEANPEAEDDQWSSWVHARSSIFVMLGIGFLMPAALLVPLVPWLSGLLVVVALVIAACLFYRIYADQDRLQIRIAGVLPFLKTQAGHLDSATATTLDANNHGGWGPRLHHNSRSILVSSGAGVMLNFTDGRSAVLGTKTPEDAESLAAHLNAWR
ncbi:hypothetical protein ACQQCD_09855 [Pseudarthrobacter sp. J1763]|uniref:hypothetical protein n=1 Tax=Pseudarthrobacter sp. J1763 TaxID=3420445 RepID=UPI003D2A00D1